MLPLNWIVCVFYEFKLLLTLHILGDQEPCFCISEQMASLLFILVGRMV